MFVKYNYGTSTMFPEEEQYRAISCSDKVLCDYPAYTVKLC